MRTTVIVGAGSAGGVVASRLSEDPSRRVILVEAGPDYVDADALPASLRDPLNPDLASHDWGFEAYFTEPAAGRPPVPYPRGKVVGGSSVVNGAVAQRGTPEDFADWAALGNDEWDWSSVLPAFVRLETDLDFPGAHHGTAGPVPIGRRPESEWPGVFHAFAAACREHGFPWCADHNDPDSTGIGPIARNELGGTRASSLVAYLAPARGRANLELLGGARATRVLHDGVRARGVELLAGGETRVVEGDEIVLSAGAVMSPHLLVHSGIGPRDALAAVGLPCRVELPGVGRSLRDHAMAPLAALTRQPGEPFAGFQAMLKYGSSSGRRNDLFLLAGLIRTSSMNFATPSGIDTAFTLAAVLGRPESTGWLVPRSADPLEAPELHMAFLSDPRDRVRLAELTRLAYDMLTTSPLADAVGEVVLPGPGAMRDDASLERWLLENVTTGFHAVGTCRMGPPGDPLAVVDQRLRVRGFENLYVADASVMPDITSGLTHLTCYMIGERFAELLR